MLPATAVRPQQPNMPITNNAFFSIIVYVFCFSDFTTVLYYRFFCLGFSTQKWFFLDVCSCKGSHSADIPAHWNRENAPSNHISYKNVPDSDNYHHPKDLLHMNFIGEDRRRRVIAISGCAGKTLLIAYIREVIDCGGTIEEFRYCLLLCLLFSYAYVCVMCQVICLCLSGATYHAVGSALTFMVNNSQLSTR